jgi:hypothetical protein
MKTLIFDQTGTVCGAGLYDHDIGVGEREHRCTDEQYADPAAWMLKDGQIVAAPPRPEPVPPEISRAQAKIQLRRANLRAAVDDAVTKAGGEVADWYAEASTWRRDSPYIAEIGSALTPPLDAAAIDTLFRDAAKIAA